MSSDTFFRRYIVGQDDFDPDGYPHAWHTTIKHVVRAQARSRCVRCGHPYTVGEHGTGQWSPCDTLCHHAGPARVAGDRPDTWVGIRTFDDGEIARMVEDGLEIEAEWRVLTVHHLDMDKANCSWWNLCALCQRCHLKIQRKVVMHQQWPWEHSEWFQPYAAGFYAHVYLGEDLTREETMERLDELLALERLV